MKSCYINKELVLKDTVSAKKVKRKKIDIPKEEIKEMKEKQLFYESHRSNK